MTVAGWLEIALALALVVVAAWPLGAFIAAVFEGRKTVLTPLAAPVERGLYRLAGVDPEKEQDWLSYTLSMIIFSCGCFLALYFIMRLQAICL